MSTAPNIVVICADASKTSENAIEYYIKHIHKPTNKIQVVHCPEYWSNIGPLEGPTPGRLQELVAETDAQTSALAEKIKNTLQAAKLDGEFIRLNGKEPWQEIVKHAETVRANLIVIGTRGMGALKRTILGSCSDSVLHHAPCPVLVCRQK